MNDDALSTVLFIIVIVVLFLLAVLVTVSVVRETERENVCVSMGYDGYDDTYNACRSGEGTVVLHLYQNVIEGK